MRVAATTAAAAYVQQLGRINWGSASTAQELVYLERLDAVLAGFPSGMAVYETVPMATCRRPSVQSVSDVRSVIRSRMQSKAQALLVDTGGDWNNKRRALQRAERELDCV